MRRSHRSRKRSSRTTTRFLRAWSTPTRRCARGCRLRTPHLQQQALREWLRVLRVGGRLIVLDAGRPTGMRGLLAGGRRESADATTSALQMAGFTSVRVLGDREGYRFLEGVRPR